METKFNFEFNFAEINMLLKACRELPYKESAGLIQYIVDAYTKQAKELDKKSSEAE